jgi:hypothetical protein
VLLRGGQLFFTTPPFFSFGYKKYSWYITILNFVQWYASEKVLRIPALNHWYLRPKLHDITTQKITCMHFDFHIYMHKLHIWPGDDRPYTCMCKPSVPNPQTSRLFMRPAATIVNYVYAIKLSNNL